MSVYVPLAWVYGAAPKLAWITVQPERYIGLAANTQKGEGNSLPLRGGQAVVPVRKLSAPLKAGQLAHPSPNELSHAKGVQVGHPSPSPPLHDVGLTEMRTFSASAANTAPEYFDESA
jgi:hypothetical protein